MTIRFGVAIVMLATAAAGPGAAAESLVDLPVVFDVVNTNRSRVPCLTDGSSYQIHGRLIGPGAALESEERAVTVLLHGVDAAGYMNLASVPDLDLARGLAERGHVTVTLDRLGYGASGRPPGASSCLGGHADTTRQVIDRLRAGDYEVGGALPWSFDRVALAGHSGGAIVAQVAAYSFPGIDALIVMAFADQGIRPAFATGVARGEIPECGFDPDVYRLFFTPEDFARDAMTGVAPEVIAAIGSARNPCGDPWSFPTVLLADALYLGTVEAPTLLLYGEHDALIDPDGAALQESRYLGSDDVTTILYDGGHTFFLEDTLAEAVQQDIAGWLQARGF